MDNNGITKKKGLFFLNAKNKQTTEMRSKPKKIISCLLLCESVNNFYFSEILRKFNIYYLHKLSLGQVRLAIKFPKGLSKIGDTT